MPLFAATSSNSVGQLASAAVLGMLAFYWLLPRPRGRSVAIGTFAALGAAIVFVLWLVREFGDPAPDTVGQVLFWLFATGAVLGGSVFVVQRNPARGAIAFAFAVISICGLFLLLAAPFLMAATIIIYAGAIIVTFLFVLMLSHSEGPSDENDRTREPLLGSLAGFGFLGLVLFTLYQSGPAFASPTVGPAFPLPAQAVTFDERQSLYAIHQDIATIDRLEEDKDKLLDFVKTNRARLIAAVGVPNASLPTGANANADRVRPIPDRLTILTDPRSQATRKLALEVQAQGAKAFNAVENVALDPQADGAKIQRALGGVRGLSDKLLLLAGQGELPARNVANIGLTLYTDSILAVEMAGAILLIATIGAVAIARRKGVA